MKKGIIILVIVLAALAAGYFLMPRSYNPATSTASNATNTINTNSSNPAPAMDIDNKQAIIHTTEGDITVEFYPMDAPKAVENFIGLASKNYYNGVIFHRVIRDFMIQGGDPTGTGRGGESYWGTNFTDELNPSTASYKAGYQKGVLAMANKGPNTNGSQFFIMLKDNPLDHLYTIFGKVTKGIDVVEKIGNTITDPETDKPMKDITIKSVEVIKK